MQDGDENQQTGRSGGQQQEPATVTVTPAIPVAPAVTVTPTKPAERGRSTNDGVPENKTDKQSNN